MPLDALLTALAALLHRLGPELTAEVLGSGALPGSVPFPAPDPLGHLAPGPWPWPTACSARRCCTRPWSGCWAVSPAGRPGGDGPGRRAPGWPGPGRLGPVRAEPGQACRPRSSRRSGRERSGHCQLPGRPPPGRARPGRGRRAGRPGPGQRAVRAVQGTSAVPDRAGPAGRGQVELPASLVESVSARCDELGPAGALLRTAAVIGPGPGRQPAGRRARPPHGAGAGRRRAGHRRAAAGRGERHVPVPARTGPRGACRQRNRRAGPRCCTGRRAGCWPSGPPPTR